MCFHSVFFFSSYFSNFFFHLNLIYVLFVVCSFLEFPLIFHFQLFLYTFCVISEKQLKEISNTTLEFINFIFVLFFYSVLHISFFQCPAVRLNPIKVAFLSLDQHGNLIAFSCFILMKTAHLIFFVFH